MTKRATLEKAVVAAMDAAAEAPMRWGVDDCALWVADTIAPALGYDPAAEVRGRYKTRRGSLRITGRAGLQRQLTKIARRHKWTRIEPFQAQPGDVGLAWTTTGGVPVLATVVCRARRWFVGRNEGGFTALRDDKVAFAWSVLPDALVGGPETRVHLRPWMPTALGPQPVAVYEPVSIGVTILSFVGITGASTVAAGIVGGVALAALSVGVSLVSSLLQASNGDSLTSAGATGIGGTVGNISDTSTLQGAQITERQAIPHKRVIVGTAYVGGALFFEQVKAPYLTMGVLVNYGEIAGVDKILIGTNELRFAGGPIPGILTPIGTAGQPDYPGNLRISVRHGSDTQTIDPLIQSRYPYVDSEYRQRGVATIVYEYHFGGTDNTAATQAAFTALWGNVARPSAYAVVRGVKCYDPRDAVQDMDDPTSWKWTNNATLIQTWYLTRPFGGRISMSSIRWDKTIVSADYDDELIGTNSGELIKRHTIDGVITLNQQPFNVIQDMLAANRAMVLESGGSVWVESSRPKAPICTIYDRILAGGITYQAAKQKTDLVNKLQVRFVSPDQDYQIVDGPVLSRSDFEAADGEQLTATLALNYTQDHRRAQRLQKAFLLSTRLAGTITCTVDVRLMAIAAQNAQEDLIGAVVTVDSVLFSKANGTYRITAVGFADDCTTLSLALTRYDSTIETNWNPETDEQPFTLAAINTA